MKKKLVILSAAAMVAAAAVPALAFENEFHGMYKMVGYFGNFNDGTTFSPAMASKVLRKDADTGFFAEQRARLQYIAKANDNLKLVTAFELDTRFGGKREAYLGTASGNDAGNIDADQLTLETKSVYLDFNCPITGTNMKVGMQPWADSYQSLFLLADMTGAQATKKFGAVTGNLGWFRFDDNTAAAAGDPGDLAADLFVADAKFTINKDMKVGASYYFVNNQTGPSTLAVVGPPAVPAYTSAAKFEKLHMFGLNADLAFGPASIKPFAAYQFGDLNDNDDISAYLVGAVAKIKVANTGAVNLSAIYLSGDKNGTGDSDSFATIGQHQTYFNAANMWLLVRNGQAINSSTSVLGNDLTVGGRGLWGVFAGYEGKVDKLFYNANVGYMQTAEERGSEDGSIGTEINAQVGYKLFDNMSVSVAGAYAFLGKGLNDDGGKKLTGFGGLDADDPYMANVQLSYTF